MSGDGLTKQEVENIVDSKLSEFKNERMRNQRMINSLQEEVEALREQVKGSENTKKGNRDKINLEHKVMKAVAKEIKRSGKNVADPEAVKERVSDQGHLKSVTQIKIDELVDDDVLIEQGSGDLVFMNKDFEDIAVIEDRYKNL